MVDEDGTFLVDTLGVTIINAAPVILAVIYDGPDGAVIEGQPITFTVATDDSPNDNLLYSFDWDNDGTYDETVAQAAVTHSFADDGTHVIRVQVDDQNGNVVSTTVSVVVANAPPQVSITGEDSLNEGEHISPHFERRRQWR